MIKAVLAAVIALVLVFPSYYYANAMSTNLIPYDAGDKDKKEEVKDKAKDEKANAEEKAKHHEEEQKDKTAEQEQQGTSSANSSTTDSAESTSNKPQESNKQHIGSTLTMVGTGEATKKDGDETANVSAKFELSVFRSTNHETLLKLSSGSITVGDVTYTVEKGKIMMAMKAHKIMLKAHLSGGDDDAKNLKLSGSADAMVTSSSDDTASAHTIKMEGKLAKWIIKMDVEVTKSG